MKKEVIKRIKAEFPDWQNFISNENKDYVMEVPAPDKSSSGGIVIQVTDDDDIWLRIFPPYSAVFMTDIDELIKTVKMFINDEILFQIILENNEWIETNLLYSNCEKHDGNSQLYSWSGNI